MCVCALVMAVMDAHSLHCPYFTFVSAACAFRRYSVFTPGNGSLAKHSDVFAFELFVIFTGII